MIGWDSAQYLLFEGERTQPAKDLAEALLARPVFEGGDKAKPLPLLSVGRALDIGCGPGNSTAVLAQAYPGAAVTGVDSSPQMIETATRSYTNCSFTLCDVSGDLSALGGGWDVVFSNACLQWVPQHAALLPRLLALLRPGGRLAVQIPMNQREPIHTIIAELVQGDEWKPYFENLRIFYTLTPEQYFDILQEAAAGFTMWETTYHHVMDSHNAILEWYRGTGLRPYLAALPQEKRPEFEAAILRRVVEAYPLQANGQLIFRFPRFFFVAVAR